MRNYSWAFFFFQFPSIAFADGLVERVQSIECVTERLEYALFEAMQGSDFTHPVDLEGADYAWEKIVVGSSSSVASPNMVEIAYGKDFRYLRFKAKENHFTAVNTKAPKIIKGHWNLIYNVFRFEDKWHSFTNELGQFIALPPSIKPESAGTFWGLSAGRITPVETTFSAACVPQPPFGSFACLREFILEVPKDVHVTAISDVTSQFLRGNVEMQDYASHYDFELWGLARPEINRRCRIEGFQEFEPDQQ
ncbi:hypothetical protein [Ruegeria sp. HKCCD7318]|uniref:hypothetical protein n=1 Tax=Ruegeria sp. HKCCD7318 TaxID=2683014 RepID=UPI0014909AD9|nr:hypothetical protein [Ruegeria sp. HKCCD7318]NOE36245.1 hypothetical protein [Ruegeria sp. HKCCD7318]